MNSFGTLVGICSLGALAACGGSSSSKSAVQQIESFDDYSDFITELANEARNEDFTDPTTLPTSGSATYDGVLGVVLTTGDAAVGTMEMRADFANSEVSGSVTDIISDQNRNLTGTLDIGVAPIDRTTDVTVDYTFTGDLTGRLRDGLETYVVDAGIEGDFVGTDNEYIGGNVFGVVTVNGDVVGIDFDESGFGGRQR